jgi:hypothetical protein
MESDEAAGRARQRDLVRRGYDTISLAYRSDDGAAAPWAGIPATRELASHGLTVLGVDFSMVQLRRARRLVPAARFVQADMAALQLSPASTDAVVAFYSLIHASQKETAVTPSCWPKLKAQAHLVVGVP